VSVSSHDSAIDGYRSGRGLSLTGTAETEGGGGGEADDAGSQEQERTPKESIADPQESRQEDNMREEKMRIALQRKFDAKLAFATQEFQRKLAGIQEASRRSNARADAAEALAH